MFTCKRCDVEARDGVMCSLCEGRFDFPCSGISEAGWRKLGEERRSTWKCNPCRSQATASPRTNTSRADMDSILSELKRLSTKVEVLPALLDNVRAIQNELIELKTISAEFSELKSSVEFVHHSVETLTNRVSSVELEIASIKSTKDDIAVLKKRCDHLEMLQRESDQRCRMNNIEIKGVPASNGEDLFELMNKLGDTINYRIPKEQINYIARVPMRGDSQHKNIICSIHNNYIKNNFVAAAKKYKGGINTSILGLGKDGGKIYINDHLTIENKTLLNKTKSFAKERGFEYVWVTGCKIFLRKNHTSPKHHIKTEQDLKKFF